jgi:hypothetical protein
MQLTTQQKIVSAVLVLAIAAFITDRWVIGHEPDEGALVTRGPARSAAVAPRPTALRQPRPAATATSADGLGSVGALATRLEILRARSDAAGQPINLDAVRDAFRPPPALVGTRKVETVDELQEAAKRFVERHKLAAVVRRQSGAGVAIIEDKNAINGSLTVAVGQSLEGFTLVAVRDRLAILRRGAQRVELRLAEDANQGTITTSEKVAGVESNR